MFKQLPICRCCSLISSIFRHQNVLNLQAFSFIGRVKEFESGEWQRDGGSVERDQNEDRKNNLFAVMHSTWHYKYLNHITLNGRAFCGYCIKFAKLLQKNSHHSNREFVYHMVEKTLLVHRKPKLNAAHCMRSLCYQICIVAELRTFHLMKLLYFLRMQFGLQLQYSTASTDIFTALVCAINLSHWHPYFVYHQPEMLLKIYLQQNTNNITFACNVIWTI